MPRVKNKGLGPFWGKRFLGILPTGEDKKRLFFMIIYKKWNAVFLALGQSPDVRAVAKNNKNTQYNGHDRHGKGSVKGHHQNR